uniref:Uncharacterized protein n=1 Tax=viral metagenome TaxID=1070528 RepID=A0A6M3KS30_9ZZZZ
MPVPFPNTDWIKYPNVTAQDIDKLLGMIMAPPPNIPAKQPSIPTQAQQQQPVQQPNTPTRDRLLLLLKALGGDVSQYVGTPQDYAESLSLGGSALGYVPDLTRLVMSSTLNELAPNTAGVLFPPEQQPTQQGTPQNYVMQRPTQGQPISQPSMLTQAPVQAPIQASQQPTSAGPNLEALQAIAGRQPPGVLTAPVNTIPPPISFAEYLYPNQATGQTLSSAQNRGIPQRTPNVNIPGQAQPTQQPGGVSGILSKLGEIMTNPSVVTSLANVAQAFDPTGIGGRMAPGLQEQAQGNLYNSVVAKVLSGQALTAQDLAGLTTQNQQTLSSLSGQVNQQGMQNTLQAQQLSWQREADIRSDATRRYSVDVSRIMSDGKLTSDMKIAKMQEVTDRLKIDTDKAISEAQINAGRFQDNPQRPTTEQAVTSVLAKHGGDKQFNDTYQAKLMLRMTSIEALYSTAMELNRQDILQELDALFGGQAQSGFQPRPVPVYNPSK